MESRLGDYTIEWLAPSRAADLQSLWERCSDFHRLQEGEPPPKTAAARALTTLPPGKSAGDKLSLGLLSRADHVVGYMDLVRDFPERGVWWVGLLMIDPDLRGQGLGSRLYRAAERWMVGQGAEAVSLAVMEQNPGGRRFWKKQGFEEIRTQTWVAQSGAARETVVMQRSLVGSDGP